MNLWYRRLRGGFGSSPRKNPNRPGTLLRFKGMSLLEVLVAMGLLALCLFLMIPIEKNRQAMRQRQLEDKILVKALEQSWEEIVAGGDLHSEVHVDGISIQIRSTREAGEELETIHLQAIAPSGKSLEIDGTLEVPRFYTP